MSVLVTPPFLSQTAVFLRRPTSVENGGSPEAT